MNHEILRDVSCLCSKLPVLDSSKFESEFYAVSKLSVITNNLVMSTPQQQSNDVMLMSYLATITKGCNTASEVCNVASFVTIVIILLFPVYSES